MMELKRIEYTSTHKKWHIDLPWVFQPCLFSHVCFLLVATNLCFCLFVCLVSPLGASFDSRSHFTLSQGQMKSSVSSLFIHTLLVYNLFQLFTSTSCWVLFIHWLDCTCFLMFAKSLEGLFFLFLLLKKYVSHQVLVLVEIWWRTKNLCAIF